jgi:hypothetical protein
VEKRTYGKKERKGRIERERERERCDGRRLGGQRRSYW